eukprot:1160766-Pelagomonas_calceolata.AAC.1
MSRNLEESGWLVSSLTGSSLNARSRALTFLYLSNVFLFPLQLGKSKGFLILIFQPSSVGLFIALFKAPCWLSRPCTFAVCTFHHCKPCNLQCKGVFSCLLQAALGGLRDVQGQASTDLRCGSWEGHWLLNACTYGHNLGAYRLQVTGKRRPPVKTVDC